MGMSIIVFSQSGRMFIGPDSLKVNSRIGQLRASLARVSADSLK